MFGKEAYAQHEFSSALEAASAYTTAMFGRNVSQAGEAWAEDYHYRLLGLDVNAFHSTNPKNTNVSVASVWRYNSEF